MTSSATRSGPTPDASPHLSRLARGGALNLAGSMVNAVCSFAVILVITRGLGQGAAGAFLEATAMFQILATAGQLGADTGLGRFVPAALVLGRPGDIRSWTRIALVPVVGICAAVAAAAFALAGPLGDLVAAGPDRDDFVTAFQVLCLFVPVTAAYFVIQNGTRAFGTMLPSVVVERLGRAAVQPLAVLAVVAAGLGPGAIALAWVGPFALATVPLTIWYVVLLHRAERARAADPVSVVPDPSGSDLAQLEAEAEALQAIEEDPLEAGPVDGSARPIRRFWAFSSPRAVAGVFQTAVLYLDVLLVGSLASTRDAAIYSTSGRWLVAGLFVTLAVNQAFQPQISRLLARGDSDRARGLFQTTTAWVIAFVWPLYLVFIVFGGVLVSVFGKGYSEGATVLAILAVAGMIGSGCGPVDMVLLMGGRSRANLVNTFVALVVNIVANIVLVPRIGVAGAAVAWLASIAVVNAMALAEVWRGVRIHPFGAGVTRIAPATVVVVGSLLAVTRLALGETLLALVVGVAVAGAAHLLVLRRLGGVLDLSALRGAFRGRRGLPGRSAAGAEGAA